MSGSLAARAVWLIGLAFAVLLDVRSRRVPNGLAAAVAVTGLATLVAREGPRGLAWGALAMFVTALLLLLPFSRGRLGGADVKLAAAAAAGIGIGSLPVFLLGTALAGGVLSAGCYFASSAEARADVHAHLLSLRLGLGLPAASPVASRIQVPYAAAIAAGAALALVWGS